MDQVHHILTIDFESWILSEKIRKEKLTNSELLYLDDKFTPESLSVIIEILKKHNQKITFFVCFKLEELYPGIIEKITKNGHEVGWHGYSHIPLTNTNILKSELNMSQKYLKKYNIKGFQAPGIIFFKRGYKVLKKYDFSYSSSTYGQPQKTTKIDGIIEIPVSTTKEVDNKDAFQNTRMDLSSLLRFGLPFGSSFFWSLLGEKNYHQKLVRAYGKGIPINLFVHNWQIISAWSKSKKFIPDEKESFFKNPLYFPYKKNVAGMFEYLLSRHKFTRMIDFATKHK